MAEPTKRELVEAALKLVDKAYRGNFPTDSEWVPAHDAYVALVAAVERPYGSRPGIGEVTFDVTVVKPTTKTVVIK